MNKKELKKIYDFNYGFYEKVCKTCKELIEKALQEKSIDVLHVSYRVKSLESFYEKIYRKQYNDPFEEIKDICGLRIICFYSNDLARVNEIIKEIFPIEDYIDKSDVQDPDRFGYRSNHYQVRLPHIDKYLDLAKYNIEVQARTVLMHTWAHIQGKLEYKKTEHIPVPFRRRLYQLSAILELADEQFQMLKIEKNALREKLSADDFDYSDSTELNIDTFMSFLDVYFPDRKKKYRYSKLLLKSLLKNGIGFNQIIESYTKINASLSDFEKEAGLNLSQDEALKVILCINNQSFLSFLEDDPLIKESLISIKKWREIINK